ncbi:MAG: Cof-type HAD-IIB family hydrolase [Pseudanabaenaceae cyanobacterium]
MQIRLLVLDIDGTISGLSNQVSPAVCTAVRKAQAQGVKVAIATGRMYRSALRFHRAVGSDCPLISYQGALIKDPATGEVVGHWAVEIPYALRLVEDFRPYVASGDLSVHLYIDDQLYVRELTPPTLAYAERSQVEPIPVGDLKVYLENYPHPLPPTKILALSDRVEVISELLTQMKDRYQQGELYLTKSVATFFEATNPIANKGTAVKHLAENILGLTADQVMTVGDSYNDLEMIQYAGIGVAMGSAPPEVQAAADWVAPDVENDGVVAAIDQFILN